MKINIQGPTAIVVSTVFVCLTFLVWAGKVPHETISAALGALLGWLAPSPLGPKGGAS
jgi:hypothetical protein